MDIGFILDTRPRLENDLFEKLMKTEIARSYDFELIRNTGSDALKNGQFRRISDIPIL